MTLLARRFSVAVMALAVLSVIAVCLPPRKLQ